MLGSVLRSLRSNTGGEVLEAYGRLSLVTVLTPRTRRLESVHLALAHQLLVRRFQISFSDIGAIRPITITSTDAATAAAASILRAPYEEEGLWRWWMFLGPRPVAEAFLSS